MKKLLYLLLLNCIIWSGCNTTPNLTSQIIVLNQEYDMPYKERPDGLSGLSKKIFINDKNEIITRFVQYNTWKLFTVNISQGQVIDSVDLKLFQRQFIHNYNFLSSDSILVAFSPNYMNDEHDKAVLIIDRNKNITKAISIEGLPVNFKNKRIHRNSFYNVDYSRFPLSITNGKIYVPLVRFVGERLCNPNDSLIGIVYVDSSSPVKKLPVCPRCAPEGYFWGFDYLKPCGTLVNNDLYAFFGNEPIIYRYNDQQDILESFYIPFHTVDKILPYRKEIDRSKSNDAYKSIFQKLLYDFLRNQFIFVARIGCDSTDSPLATAYGNDVYSFVLLDSNLNKIGEGIVPEGYNPDFVPYKEGFLLNKFGTKGNVYTYFTYETLTHNSSMLKEQIKTRRERFANESSRLPMNQAFRKYFNELIGEKGKEYKKFIVIPSSSCPQCQPMYASILGKYKNQWEAKKIAVILIGNAKMIEDFNEMMKLGSSTVTWNKRKSPVIYTDSDYLYEKYIGLWINLRYLEFDRNDKIIKDQIFNPADMQNLINLLAE